MSSSSGDISACLQERLPWLVVRRRQSRNNDQSQPGWLYPRARPFRRAPHDRACHWTTHAHAQARRCCPHRDLAALWGQDRHAQRLRRGSRGRGSSHLQVPARDGCLEGTRTAVHAGLSLLSPAPAHLVHRMHADLLQFLSNINRPSRSSSAETKIRSG